jgi:MotA/TolQ/ExbB proton channel family
MKAVACCYRSSSCNANVLEAITALPLSGRALLLFTIALFVAALLLGLALQRCSRFPMELLIKSIRRSEDLFVDNQGIVQEIRGSYRLKLSKLESIDTAFLVSAHLNKWFVIKIGGFSASFQQVSAFLSGAPSYLVTLGLIGTFLGLIENLSELSGLIAASNSTDMSGLLGSMGTAFTVSLFGVSFSLVLWLWEHILGIDTIDERMTSLIAAYLEGVVQNDVKRYSLIGEAVARIETYLSEFLANFTERVGDAIDRAMRDKLDEVFDTMTRLAKVSSNVIEKMDQGATRYEASSELFRDASQIVSKPNLGQSVVVAAAKLVSSHERFADSVESMSGDLDMMRGAISTMNDFWAERVKVLSLAMAKNQELLRASTGLAEQIGRSSTMFADRLAVMESSVPVLAETIETSSQARDQAQELLQQAQVCTSSIAQASESAAKTAAAVTVSTEELKNVVGILSEAVRELRTATQNNQ